MNDENGKKNDFFSATKGFQGEIVCGLAFVAAAGLVLSGYGSRLFSGPMTIASVGSTVITLLLVLFGAYFLFLIGATLYNGPMKRLAFVKWPILKGLILAALMGVIVFLIQGWFGV